MPNNIGKIKDLFFKELNTLEIAYLKSIDWEITIQITGKEKVYYLNLWEFKDLYCEELTVMDRIVKAIENRNWYWIKIL